MPLLRPAGPGDVPAMASILSDWIDETDWMPRLHTRDEDRAFVAGLSVSHEVQVACGADVMGFIACRTGEIDALYVSASARRQGVGGALLAAAKKRNPQLSLWTFAANAPALAFYSARGFVEEGRTDGQRNEEHLPDVRLVWRNGGEA